MRCGFLRRSRRRVAVQRRVRRIGAVLALVGFMLMLTTQDAVAMGATLPPVSLSSLSGFVASLTAGSPHWGKVPRQQSGTAAGHGHEVSAAATIGAWAMLLVTGRVSSPRMPLISGR